MIVISAMFGVVSTMAFAQTGALRQASSASLQVRVKTDSSAPLLRSPVPDADLNQLRAAIAAARLNDVAGSQAAAKTIASPVAHKLADWILADSAGDQLGFIQLDAARRELVDWPRAGKRRQLTEDAIETAGLDATAVIGWFAADPPKTASGAMALAAAYNSTGHQSDAQTLIRQTWRTQAFDAETQKRLLARYSGLLSSEDHIARANLLLYGPHGPALKELLPLLPTDQAALVQARMALRADARNAEALTIALSASQQSDRGLAFERAGYLRRRNQLDAALQLAASLPTILANDDAASRVWTERRQLINVALKRGDYRAAYDLAASAGLNAPGELADAEFFAGWLALSKMKDPSTADGHFARIQAAGTAPITQARALFWRGRAHEALGDRPNAKAYYAQAARYPWTFYGQLAAGQDDQAVLKLDADPAVTPADRAHFNGLELVQAAGILADLGEHDLLRTFVLFTDDSLTSPADFAQLADLAKAAGDQDLALRVARTAAQRGVIMPVRGYPVRAPPDVTTSAEPALILAITRQESNFDPAARSGADARGLMQVIPATGDLTARKLGIAYSADMLFDADYNARIGSAYLGQLVDRFSGSYVLAIAAYNAGPNRPDDWVSYCGDPRTPSVDPLDFIECIPFSETRNYVMRVLENLQVYRARLNDGQAAPTLAADLRRGGVPTLALQP